MQDWQTDKSKLAISPLEARRFVIHEHQTSHHHYDLRLEVDGVIKSWALPKGPSLDPLQRRVAVELTDHGADFCDLEGTVTDSLAQGGSAALWDKGRYTLGNGTAFREQEQSGRLLLIFRGEKLKGRFCLRRLAGYPKHWALIKMKDIYADAHWRIDGKLDGRNREEASRIAA